MNFTKLSNYQKREVGEKCHLLIMFKCSYILFSCDNSSILPRFVTETRFKILHGSTSKQYPQSTPYKTKKNYPILTKMLLTIFFKDKA